MATEEINVDLFIKNRRKVTYVLSNRILLPLGSAQIKFTRLESIRHVMKMEERHEVDIATDIPPEIMEQLGFSEEIPQDEEDAEASTENDDSGTVETMDEPDQQIEEEEEEEEEATFSAKSEEEEEVTEPEEATDVPDWYLTKAEIDEMTKAKIIEHFASVDEMKVPTGKTAAETKEIANTKLEELFPGHMKG